MLPELINTFKCLHKRDFLAAGSRIRRERILASARADNGEHGGYLQMVAYRINGGRVFYVEHECYGETGEKHEARHTRGIPDHNKRYVVRMFYLGDTEQTESSVNDFAYMTENVTGNNGIDAYVNCPLCGSDGHIVVNDHNNVEIRESYGKGALLEYPFR